MLDLVYPILRGFIVFVLMLVVLLMVLRLIFNYTDPNPFGTIGRFAYTLKKHTEKLVYPVATFLSRYGVDVRIAPFISILVLCVIAYFVLQLFYNIFFTFDGVALSIKESSITKLVGYLLFGILGTYSLLIVARIIMSWVSSYQNRFYRFLMRITDPVLEPFRRIIPPLGMFDISPIIVLLLLGFIQSAVAGVFLAR
ncbi:MAG: YggT family protein [Pyrinomonadaceae bacterium]